MTRLTRRQFHGSVLGAAAAATLPTFARSETVPILHARQGSTLLVADTALDVTAGRLRHQGAARERASQERNKNLSRNFHTFSSLDIWFSWISVP